MTAAAKRRPNREIGMGVLRLAIASKSSEQRIIMWRAEFVSIRYSPFAISLGFDAGLLDHLAPARSLALDELGQVLRAAADGGHAIVGEPAAHLGVAYHGVEGLVEPGDDRGRGFG